MLIEGLGSATIVNGLVRIETLHRNAVGEDVAGEQMLIPVNRMSAVSAALQLLLQKAEEAAKNSAEPAEVQ